MSSSNTFGLSLSLSLSLSPLILLARSLLATHVCHSLIESSTQQNTHNPPSSQDYAFPSGQRESDFIFVKRGRKKKEIVGFFFCVFIA
jgi:hypothetical protein